MTMTLNLHQFDHIMINTSGGKDSQVAMDEVVRIADLSKYPRRNITAFHADLGRMEWKGVKDLVKEQAAHYKLRLIIKKYRNKNGDNLSLLDYVRKRGKWPDNKNRFCTSDFKRGPGGRAITEISKEIPKKYGIKLLNVFGFRAEESPARAKRKVLTRNEKLTTKVEPATRNYFGKMVVNKHAGLRRREVWDWLPIHDWEEGEVWETIHRSGVAYHPAYDKGMPRLSCCFCIFAPRAALMIAGKENPELLKEYANLEEEIGHDFQHKKPIRKILEAVEDGEGVNLDELDGTWNM